MNATSSAVTTSVSRHREAGGILEGFLEKVLSELGLGLNDVREMWGLREGDHRQKGQQ